MNNQLQVFNNAEFGKVRTIVDGDKILFCASDIAKALGYSNTSKAINDHCKGITKRYIGVETGKKSDGSIVTQEVQVNFIPEGDIYRLIVRSKLPTAEKFESWVFDEVLPSIRKNGMYMTNSVAEQAITNPTEFLAKAVLIAQEELEKVKKDNQIMKPKAEYFDTLVDRNTLVNFRDTAKEFHLKQNVFINWLLEKNFIYRDSNNKIKPTAGYDEYFHIKECTGKSNKWSGVQTLITPKGREAFRLLLNVK